MVTVAWHHCTHIVILNLMSYTSLVTVSEVDPCYPTIFIGDILNSPLDFIWFPGLCDGGIFNREKCGFDYGDCDEFNEEYPNCKVKHPRRVGNGRCDKQSNIIECKWDGGDCTEFNNKYPNCRAQQPSQMGNGGTFNLAEYSVSILSLIIVVFSHNIISLPSVQPT